VGTKRLELSNENFSRHDNTMLVRRSLVVALQVGGEKMDKHIYWHTNKDGYISKRKGTTV
jgi:hypothetical protein